MQVHAEGVEQDSQSKALLELDCDVVQGYAYAKPLPLIEFVKYCKEFK